MGIRKKVLEPLNDSARHLKNRSLATGSAGEVNLGMDGANKSLLSRDESRHLQNKPCAPQTLDETGGTDHVLVAKIAKAGLVLPRHLSRLGAPILSLHGKSQKTSSSPDLSQERRRRI